MAFGVKALDPVVELVDDVDVASVGGAGAGAVDGNVAGDEELAAEAAEPEAVPK